MTDLTRRSAAVALVGLILCTLALMSTVCYGQRQVRRPTAAWQRDEQGDIVVPDSAIKVESTVPIGQSGRMITAPTAADPAAAYSDVGTFSGSFFAPDNEVNYPPAITRMMADDLTFIGSPPYKIGRFSFSVCNANATAGTFRPRVRFYLDDNGGVPGTLITGFSFNALSVAAGSCSTLFAALVPASPQFSSTTQKMWAGMLFDNSGGTATTTELNNIGMGIFATPDTGSSADLFFLTTAAPASGASFLSNNPGPGSNTNFGGAPVANFGWEFRQTFTVAAITKASSDPRGSSGIAHWTVTFDTSAGSTSGANITGLTASNFSLSTTGVTGATITQVTQVGSTYDVAAYVGTGSGTIQLNMTNDTNANTKATNTFPFAGGSYTVSSTTAAQVGLSGRVTDLRGNGVRGARVTFTDGNGAMHLAVTNAFGYYTVSEVPAGSTLIATIQSRGLSFASRVVQVFDGLTNVNFTSQ